MKCLLASNLSIRKIEDDLFILNRSDSTIHYLNKTGAIIWVCITEGKSLDEITEYFHNRFEVEKDNAREDIFQFMMTLTERKLATLEQS